MVEKELGVLVVKEVVKEVVPPTISLVKGRLLKKTVKIQLSLSTVFTLYGSISLEDYNGFFVKKIAESKIAKNKLNINGLTVNYFVSPNMKPIVPFYSGVESSNETLNEEIMSEYTLIDQIRLFIYPLQEEMTPQDLENFVKCYDDFVTKLESDLRGEKKIPLNMVVKHLILGTEDSDFLKGMSKSIMDDSLRIYASRNKVTITYTKIEKLLNFIRTLW